MKNLKKLQNNVVSMQESMQDSQLVNLASYRPTNKNPKDKYIVRNLIEKGLIMIYGGTGTGKTMLTEWLCYQLTRADIRQPNRQQLFLGRSCYPCTVYYYTLETMVDILYDRAKKYDGHTSKKFNVLDYSATKLTDEQWLEDMKYRATQHVLAHKKEHLVFVLDPLIDLDFVKITDINNSNDMKSFMTEIMRFTHKPKYGYPTVIIVHHTNKVGNYLGSSAIGDIVNGNLEISKIDNSRINLHLGKMRQTELPSDMLLLRNKNLTYSLIDEYDFADVEDYNDRKNIIKIANELNKKLTEEKNQEEKQAEQEERIPNVISSSVLEDNAITLLSNCNIVDILPNNFYKFLDKYRTTLSYNGIELELLLEENKIRLTYTPNNSSISLPDKPVHVEDLPEKEKPKRRKIKNKTKIQKQKSKKNTTKKTPANNDVFEEQLSLL